VEVSAEKELFRRKRELSSASPHLRKNLWLIFHKPRWSKNVVFSSQRLCNLHYYTYSVKCIIHPCIFLRWEA